MVPEETLHNLLKSLQEAEAQRPPIDPPGAPVRRTPLEARAYEQGRIATLEYVLGLFWHPESCTCGNCRDKAGVRHPVMVRHLSLKPDENSPTPDENSPAK